MLRKTIVLAVIVFSMSVLAAQAQEGGGDPVGIDSICGESALTITKAPSDTTGDDAGTQALDDLLHSFVTLPSDLESTLSQRVPKPPAPGAVIFVDSPQGRYYRGIGVADVSTCAPLDPTAPFPIGSNTKMFTTAVIYQLQEEGLLTTSDLVSKYLPDEIALWNGAETITIDMLLAHTSGLPDYLNSHDPKSVGAQIGDPTSGMLEHGFTPQELVENAAIAGPELLFTPGEEGQWTYSNTGYIMLGQIIEAVTGKSYSETVTERIIDRLGLEHTVVVADHPSADLHLATQYLASPFTRVTDGWNFSQAWSAGNIVSTPEDMEIFLKAYYSGALYQHPETLAAQEAKASPSTPIESDDFYYMHGGYYKDGFLGHGGQTLGTESDVGFDPENDVVIVTWANTSESYTVEGVFFIGHALGLTQSLDDIIANLRGAQTEAANAPQSLAPQDVAGVTLTTDRVVIGSTNEVKQAAEGSTYSITFSADGQMTIVADCNTVTAAYTSGENEAIHIDLGVTTLVACPPGSIADDFLQVLGEASSARILDLGSQYLAMITTDDSSSIVFSVMK